MLYKKKIAVVVPAYNEERQILNVIKGIPDFVDHIVVVDDCSKDKTLKITKDILLENSDKLVEEDSNQENKTIPEEMLSQYNRAELIAWKIMNSEKRKFVPSTIFKGTASDRLILISHQKNSGVGAAIVSGYKWCRDNEIDCTAVMAGDGQMDPEELKEICLPVIEEKIDYVKGNRLIHRSAFFVIPRLRFFGNSILSLFTKIASGYWSISDSQSGYTAISLKALNSLRLNKIYKKYGVPNDLLVKLNIAFCSIKEVEIKPVYNIGENSKMKIWKVVPKISFLLLKSFFLRLYIKYLFRNFHPIFLLYHFSIFLFLLDIPFVFKMIRYMISGTPLSIQSLLLLLFLTFTGLQSLFFAMWMDMQDNEKLQR